MEEKLSTFDMVDDVDDGAEKIYKLWYDDIETIDDLKNVITQCSNNKANFGDFIKRDIYDTAFKISGKEFKEFGEKDYINFIQQAFADNGLKNRGSLYGSTELKPSMIKKHLNDDLSRNTALLYAFGLHMNVADTNKLLTKVCRGRELNPKNHELIYWYCLKNDLTYDEMCEYMNDYTDVLKPYLIDSIKEYINKLNEKDKKSKSDIKNIEEAESKIQFINQNNGMDIIGNIDGIKNYCSNDFNIKDEITTQRIDELEIESIEELRGKFPSVAQTELKSLCMSKSAINTFRDMLKMLEIIFIDREDNVKNYEEKRKKFKEDINIGKIERYLYIRDNENATDKNSNLKLELNNDFNCDWLKSTMLNRKKIYDKLNGIKPITRDDIITLAFLTFEKNIKEDEKENAEDDQRAEFINEKLYDFREYAEGRLRDCGMDDRLYPYHPYEAMIQICIGYDYDPFDTYYYLWSQLTKKD